MAETVSIIIPVYRAAETVERCVDSLLNGNYPNMEIILVDDRSPDNSWSVCQRLQRQHPCVRAFQTECNGGPSAARNRGLQEMSGDFLMFVDSDDWVEPDFVSSFMHVWEQHQPDLIACGYWNHDMLHNATTDFFGWGQAKEVSSVNLRESLVGMYEGRLLQQIWNKCFRTDIVRKNNLSFDSGVRTGEDFRFLLSYLQCVQGNHLVCINKPLYHYIRCSGNSLMSQFGREKIDEPLKNLQTMYQIMGFPAEEIEKRLQDDRRKQIELYAYLIMHNAGMAHSEKKQLILDLDSKRGRALYHDNLTLLIKERILIWLKKLGLR